MSINKSQNNQEQINSNNNAIAGDEVEVLYQKLGEKWFAFSLIDNEVFVCPVTEDEMNAARAKSIRGSKIIGNS
jgi:hypothetical protein